MGILAGTIKIRRYTLAAPIEGNPYQHADAIQRDVFAGFADGAETAVGWAPIDDAYGSDLPAASWWLAGGSGAVGLTMRTDVKRIPQSLLKRESKAIEAQWKAERNLEHLTRAEREEAKELAKEKLLARALPSTKLADMVYFPSAGEVWSWATGSDAETFRALFRKTFGVGLTPVVQIANDPNMPSASGFLEWLWWQAATQGGAIDLVEPELFVWVDDRVTFEDGEGQRVAATNGDVANATEAKAALVNGKRVTSIRFGVTIGDQEHKLTIKGPHLDLLSVKIPKISSEKDDDAMATALLRLDAIGGIVRPLAELWTHYCDRGAEVDGPQVEAWKIAKGEAE